MSEPRVLIGDLSELAANGVRVDAVVNAANSGLRAGGGVCGAIFSAAGPERLAAACAAIGGCPTGSAVWTPAFDLERQGVSWIIHAVGPLWDPRDPEAADALLAATYRAVVRVAVELGASSIAIPAISTGIYGFPAARAAAVAVAALRAAPAAPDTIYLVAFDQGSAALLQAALDAELT